MERRATHGTEESCDHSLPESSLADPSAPGRRAPLAPTARQHGRL